ncbi:hypothetical protein PUN28_017738 [Cardiocondyla obscurior]|uniref:RING-type domain-containing protein n=1 Tax=Cardiocondyla obscurior TaxID=286306 RepID=A0AAW2EN71_9HYME
MDKNSALPHLNPIMDKEMQNDIETTMENSTLQSLYPNMKVTEQNATENIEVKAHKNVTLPNLIPISHIKGYNAMKTTMHEKSILQRLHTNMEYEENAVDMTIHNNLTFENLNSTNETMSEEKQMPIDMTMHKKITLKSSSPIINEKKENVPETTMHEDLSGKDSMPFVLGPNYLNISADSSNSEIIDLSSDFESVRNLSYISDDAACDLSNTSSDNTVPANFDGIIFNSSLQTNETSSESLINLTNQVSATAGSSKIQNKPEIKVEENSNLYKPYNTLSYTEEIFQNPLPGCSKDSDDKSLNCASTSSTSGNLLKEAKQIQALLPRFSNYLIYKTLSANQLAKNRVELTLWDLLPTQRPVPLVVGKRKSSDKESLEECEINLDAKINMEGEEQHGTCEKVGNIKMRILENKPHELSTRSKVNVINQNLPETAVSNNAAVLNDTNNNMNQQSLIPVKMSKLDEVIQDEPMNIEYDDNVNESFVLRNLKTFKSLKAESYLKEWEQPYPKVKTKSNFFVVDNAESSATKLLRPPKFVFEDVVRPCQNDKIYKSSNPILSPSKLHYIRTSFTGATWRIKDKKKVSNTNFNDSIQNFSLSRLPNASSKYKIASRDMNSRIVSSNNKTASCDANGRMFRSHSFSVPTSSRKMETQNANQVNIHTRKVTEPFYNAASNSATLAQGSSYQNNLNVISNSVQKPSTSTSQVSNREDGKQPVEVTSKPCPVTSKKSDNSNSKTAQINVNTESNVKTVENKEIILNEKATKLYIQLIPMFPSIKTAYIKRLCYEVSKRPELMNSEALWERLIDILLNCKQENFKEVQPVQVVEELNLPYDINEQYADLLMLFPEADPVYLRQAVEEMQGDHAKYNEFVQSKLENPDYPTREQYLTKKKITEQQKQYTTDFHVEKFLEIFPDPFEHFENEKRICQFNPHAIDFLKYYFSKLKVNTLVKAYSNCLNNLSLTAKTLESLNSDMKTKRSNKMAPTEDIPFLQECAFVQHKVELAKYLDDKKIKEREEFNKLKANNELLECQCCYDNECMPLKCSTCEDGHIFCNLCIVRSIDIVLGDGNTRVDCLIKCGSEFPLSVLQRVLPPTKFSILLCKRQEAEVIAAGVEGLVSCPFCHFASIPPAEDKIFKCFNPECMKESCRLCKELNHIPLKCNEKKSEFARLYLEEKMTEALVRKCYKCSRMFFKEEGCNKMTCICGAQMCYICDKPVTDYKHFQGQGAEKSNLCPLWSDDRRLNAEGVIKVCEETIKHIKEKDPNIDINVKALLPKLPPKRTQ